MPFPFDRLTSSEANEEVRYSECRQLASLVEGEAGIGHPSAGYLDPAAWNLTLFGAKGDRWQAEEVTEVTRPNVPLSAIRPIERA